LTNTTTWKPKQQGKCPPLWHLCFFLSLRGFLVRGVYLLLPFPLFLTLPKWTDKSNIHSGNNNLLRGART
jgi:hypothetical protein